MTKVFTDPSLLRKGILFCILLIIVFGAYSPVLKNGFVFWDDDVHLFDNITVRTLDAEHLRDIFTGKVNKLYIPLTIFSFALEYHFFGYEPLVYHLNNLLLHMAVVLMVFGLGRSLGLSVMASGAAALLFGVHPMHVESVAWVTERKDVLYSFFYMIALLSYTRYLSFTRVSPVLENKKSYRFLVLTVFSGILSMLAKPMALSLPLILWLLDWFYRRPWSRGTLLEKVPLCLAIGGITLASYVEHARVPGQGFPESLLIWSWTAVFYLRQFILPLVLVPVYQLPKPVVWSDPQYLLSMLVLAGLVLSLIRFRKHRWFHFAMAFYFFSIFFLLRFDDHKDINIVADRFMYLPSLGICYLAGIGVERLGRMKSQYFRLVSAGLIILVVAVCWVKTFNQTLIWRDSITLWNHELRFYPQSAAALNNLAAALREEDAYKQAEDVYRQMMAIERTGEAADYSQEAIQRARKVGEVIGLYQRAIAAYPNFVDSHFNLGKMYAEIGHVAYAVESFKSALLLEPKYKDVHFSLGELYDRAGDYSRAVYAFEQTIQLNPDNEDVYVEVISAYNDALRKNPENVLYRESREDAISRLTSLVYNKRPRVTSFFNLGFLYGGMGDFERAESAYQMALDINPRHANTLYNLGNLYKDRGMFREALKFYTQAISVDPRKSDAYLSMGVIFERQGRQEEAKKSFEAAVKADPENAKAHFNLGYTEEREGKYRKALESYKKSISLDSENSLAHYNLGNLYARLKENGSAIEAYLDAVQADPNYKDAWINLSILSFKEGKFDLAVKYCDQAVLLGYNAPQGYLRELEKHRNQ